MTNYSLLELIQFWDSIIHENKDPLILESAFLQIYVAFEKEMSETFILFCMGKSHGIFLPNRKLEFAEESQLLELIKGEARFVDFSRAIDRCSNHIFVNNVFGLIASDSNYSTSLIEMKALRNFLAHRSQESRETYMKKVLYTSDPDKFKEPGLLLLSNAKSSTKTIYYKYIDAMEEIYQLLRNDEFLNSCS